MADIEASEFDRATVMTADAEGAWRGQIIDGWDIGGNANGGYLLALAARSMVGATGRPHPITLTAHYLSPGRPGAVSMRPEIVKAGKRFTTATGALVGADGRSILQVLGAFGDVRSGAGDGEFVQAEPPEVAPFEACEARDPHNGTVYVPLMERIDVRLDPSCVGFQHGQKTGRSVMTGWFALADGRPMDALALCLACDAFPPSVFQLDLPPGWVPTLELTLHVRDVPAPGPLRCRFSTRFVTNGMFEEDGEMWDSAGRLVALSRQMALLARAPS